MDIYLITNLIDGRQYIGIEKNYNSEYYGSGKLIKKSIEEIGKENFRKEIIIDNKYIDSWEECFQLESVCILTFNTLMPNGYNQVLYNGSRSIEHAKLGGRITGKKHKELGKGIFAPGMQRKGGKQLKELGRGIFAPGMASKGGKIAGKTLAEKKKGIFDPAYNDKRLEWNIKGGEEAKKVGAGIKGGKIGGKISGKQNKDLGRGIFAPGMQSKGGKIGGEKTKKLGVGIHAPGMGRKGGRIGGKMHAFILVEIDGLIQQMTLKTILEL